MTFFIATELTTISLIVDFAASENCLGALLSFVSSTTAGSLETL
jgi:hypothetical protein